MNQREIRGLLKLCSNNLCVHRDYAKVPNEFKHMKNVLKLIFFMKY